MNFFSHSRKLCQDEQIKSRKNFPVNLSPDKPETGFLFFRVVEEIFIFLFSLSECTFSPQERKVSRSKQNMSFLCENHFQPANPESLTNQKSPIRSLVVIVLKLKSQLSSFENLRGIVRPKKLSEVGSLSKVNCLSMSKSGQFVKDFSTAKSVFFHFLLCRITTEAMGIGGLRERSLSHSDKVNAGAKPAKCTSVSQCL